MEKNILILNGSPRKGGNTAVLVNWLEDELEQKDQPYKKYDLYAKQFKGCAHCDACKKVSDRHGCVLPDDALEILDAFAKAEVIVIASPIYCWSFSGCASTFLDRLYSFFKNENGGCALLAGKKILGIFTSGGDAFSGMQYCDAALREICLWSNMSYLGTVGATKCTTPENLKLQKNLHNELIGLVAEF